MRGVRQYDIKQFDAVHAEDYAETAKLAAELFAEVIIAPKISDAAKTIFMAKKNLRVLETGTLPDPQAPGMTVRSLAGGYLLQNRDGLLTSNALKVVTKRQPSEAEMADLLFAFTVYGAVSNVTLFTLELLGQRTRYAGFAVESWVAMMAMCAAGIAVAALAVARAFCATAGAIPTRSQNTSAALASPCRKTIAFAFSGSFTPVLSRSEK